MYLTTASTYSRQQGSVLAGIGVAGIGVAGIGVRFEGVEKFTPQRSLEMSTGCLSGNVESQSHHPRASQRTVHQWSGDGEWFKQP